MEILYVLRLNQTDKAKPAGIYCRITCNGARAGDFSTFLQVEKRLWDSKRQLIRGSSRQAQADNEKLALIRLSITEYYNQLNRENKPVTAQLLKNLYLGKEKLSYTLLEAYRLFMDQQEKLHTVDEVALNTLKGYRSRRNMLEAYLKATKQASLGLSDFSIKFGMAYVLWLRTSKKLAQNTAMRHIRGVSQVLDYAVINEWLPYNQLASFPYKFDKVKDPVSLNSEELARLESFVFLGDRLRRVCDLFLFQCYTGLAYVDLASFQAHLHTEQEAGAVWIVKQRSKTDVTAVLPLFSKAQQILAKYGGQLPVISNQKYNDYLKLIGDAVGLRKKLTSHVARKTAAQAWLEAGTPPETVAKMLGQADYRMLLKYYARVSRDKMRRDTEGLN